MNAQTIVAGLIVVALSCGQAWAWGYEGHEVVGSIADQMLHDHAKKEVHNNLGFELRVAAPWPDCVRSVVKHADGSFEYAPSKQEYRIPCTSFEGPTEKARMEDYVSRNWNVCVYQGGKAGCEDSYHFADVAIQHDDYKRGYVGTGDHDIVSAINASISKLKDLSVPAPFMIRDKKEALFLLAHFVGDLHQPLHVGAIYLDPNGKIVNPDDGGSLDPATETRGGNSIFEKVDNSCKGNNLHTDWDAIPKSLGTSADEAMLTRANGVPKTPGPVEGFAAAWAGDTVIAAHSAFAGLTFTGACKGHWLVHFANRQKYVGDEKKLKLEQLAKGGARLAELLNNIWP
jgi:S1/P1 Nuclease